MVSKKPVRVCVTGAGGQICYSLIPSICNGLMLGSDQPVILHLLEIPYGENAMKGLVMELEDSTFPLLAGVVATVDAKVAYKDVDIAIFVGAFPRREGMLRSDLLAKNAGIFKSAGADLNKYAKKNVKVLVVGNPANTNCLILKKYCPDLPAENFTAMTRLDQNRAKGIIAKKCSVNVTQVNDVIIWGNHSKTQYPDVNHGYVTKGGKRVSIRELVSDDKYLNDEFITTVQYRGAEIIKARKFSSACSAAKAIMDHIKDWWFGTGDKIVSMGVTSNGEYGVPKGLIFSFPVTVDKKGKYTIVKGLSIDKFSAKKLKDTADELVSERKTAFEFLEKN